jgi:hypothetical protein
VIRFPPEDFLDKLLQSALLICFPVRLCGMRAKDVRSARSDEWLVKRT